jgi:hypothetical protein
MPCALLSHRMRRLPVWGVGGWCMIPERCEAFDTPCRFCSAEHLIVPFAPLVEDPRSKRLIAGPVEHRSESLGTLCNQLSKWTRDITQCPARLGLVYWCGEKAPGTGVYARIHTEAEMRWMVREGGDTTRTQEIVHFGQQVLGV